MAPATDEFEITIFGSGDGECCLLHVGGGKWVIIDSCLHTGSRSPIALAYLRSIGVDPSKQVGLVVATHWHGDHVRGLAAMFRECKNSDFAFPNALTATLTFDLFARAKASPVYSKTATYELAEIFHEIGLRKGRGEKCERQAVNSYRLLTIRGVAKGEPETIALSPSDEVSLSYAQKIKYDAKDQHLTYVALPESNDISMALCFQFKQTSFLFGADLEIGDDDSGWIYAVRRFKGWLTKSDFIKIPHHGSRGAHLPEMWSELLVSKPVGVVTAFKKGKNPPPTLRDILRLKGLCSKLSFTGRSKPPPTKSKNIASHLAFHGINITTKGYYAAGFVTLRKPMAGVAPWTITHGGKAKFV